MMMGGSWRLVRAKSRGGDDRRGNAERGYNEGISDGEEKSEMDEDETRAEVERVRYFYSKKAAGPFFRILIGNPPPKGREGNREEGQTEPSKKKMAMKCRVLASSPETNRGELRRSRHVL